MPPSTTAIECVARPGGHCLELPSRPLSWSMQPARLPISSPCSLDVGRSHGRSRPRRIPRISRLPGFFSQKVITTRRDAKPPVPWRHTVGPRSTGGADSTCRKTDYGFISQLFMPRHKRGHGASFSATQAMRQELFSDTYLHVTTRPRGSGDVILKRGRGRAQLLRTDPTR